MNKKMIFALAAAASISVFALAGGLQAHLSSKTLTHAKAKGAGPTNLQDANSDKNANAIRSVKKGGAKAKGGKAVGVLHVDNRTDYAIDSWVDGYYVGRIGAWGDIYANVYSGSHEFFARSAGETTTWGPTTYYQSSESTYTMRLD